MEGEIWLSASGLKFWKKSGIDRSFRMCYNGGMICRDCGKSFKVDKFHPKILICRKCAIIREKSRNSIYVKEYNAKLKAEAMKRSGGPVCTCCGEKHIEFLAIDHIEGGGQAWRRQNKIKSGGEFYRWLRRNNYPNMEKYRVLCHNCNFAIGIYGRCPHKVKGDSN